MAGVRRSEGPLKGGTAVYGYFPVIVFYLYECAEEIHFVYVFEHHQLIFFLYLYLFLYY